MKIIIKSFILDILAGLCVAVSITNVIAEPCYVQHEANITFNNLVLKEQLEIVKLIADGMKGLSPAIVANYTQKTPKVHDSEDIFIDKTFRQLLWISKFKLIHRFTPYQENKNITSIFINKRLFSNSSAILSDRNGNEFVLDGGEKVILTQENSYKYASHYSPLPYLFDGQIIMFISPQKAIDYINTPLFISKKYKHQSNLYELTDIENDFLNMEEPSFLEKYHLQTVYSNHMYKVGHRCIFIYCQKPLRSSCLMNSSKLGEMISLTKPELSDLVYLSHLVNYPTDTNGYCQVVSQSSKYINLVKNLETELGKKVYDRLKQLMIISE